MAYVVGLTATDGCLVSGSHALDFKSEDRDLVETYLRVLGRTNRISPLKTRWGGIVYRTQFRDTRLYRWFLTIGLTPRKSLTLGAIDVPDQYIAALARGLMDGDGSIANFVHVPTRRTYPKYIYERLIVQFNSASRAHIDWLRARLDPLIGDRGSVQRFEHPGKHDMYRLAFGKYASIALLRLFYADVEAPRLMRKWRIWDDYQRRINQRASWRVAEQQATAGLQSSLPGRSGEMANTAAPGAAARKGLGVQVPPSAQEIDRVLID
jgi:hypothetical protein